MVFFLDGESIVCAASDQQKKKIDNFGSHFFCLNKKLYICNRGSIANIKC